MGGVRVWFGIMVLVGFVNKMVDGLRLDML